MKTAWGGLTCFQADQDPFRAFLQSSFICTIPRTYKNLKLHMPSFAFPCLTSLVLTFVCRSPVLLAFKRLRWQSSLPPKF